jgi:SAM-dependent methyltransferase
METALFGWQADAVNYVNQTAGVYELLASGIKEHCGGFDGKTVLEIGAAFQLPHGGLNLVLAIRDGARQCFGIDITHPCMGCSAPDKVAFWKAAKERLGVECDGIAQNRVCFWSTDVLHYDDFFSKIVQLQMSASNMWFRDGMFDVVFSNAVFEHVKDARNVLREMYRVLKPGGSAYHHWNPATGLVMGGHDVGMPYYYPWAHLRLSEPEHVEKLATVLADPALYTTAFPPGHTLTPERAATLAKDPKTFRRNMMEDLNMLRVGDLHEFAKSAGFVVLYENFNIHEEDRAYLTPEIREELPGYSDDELLTFFHSFALHKPLSAAR